MFNIYIYTCNDLFSEFVKDLNLGSVFYISNLFIVRLSERFSIIDAANKILISLFRRIPTVLVNSWLPSSSLVSNIPYDIQGERSQHDPQVACF